MRKKERMEEGKEGGRREGERGCVLRGASDGRRDKRAPQARHTYL